MEGVEMSEQERDKARALVPIDERRVLLMEGDEVLAVRAEDGTIYLPLRPVCESLGLSYRPQRRRIQRDPARVRPDLQDKLLVYKRWVIDKVFEAFQRETGIGQEIATAPATPAMRDDETLSLAHIRDMALAIAAFAEQQIAFAAQQQAQDRRIDVLDEGHGQLSARLDRAAGVVGGLVRSVKALEQRLAPGNVLSEEQAAEVSDQVKTVAEALTARDVAAGAAPRDWYGSIYRTLYKRYNVAGYRRIRQEQYADVLSWLDDFHRMTAPAPQADGEE